MIKEIRWNNGDNLYKDKIVKVINETRCNVCKNQVKGYATKYQLKNQERGFYYEDGIRCLTCFYKDRLKVLDWKFDKEKLNLKYPKEHKDNKEQFNKFKKDYAKYLIIGEL